MTKRTMLIAAILIAFLLIAIASIFSLRSFAPSETSPPPSQTSPPSSETSPPPSETTSPPPSETSPPPPPPPPDPFVAVDQALEELKLGNIAYNSPKTMNIKETAVIHLALSLATALEELKNKVSDMGEIEDAQIRISDRMEASLSGPGFSITAITPEEQAISPTELTEWKWEIAPVRKGRHRLHLTMSALLEINGSSSRRAIRTFDRVIVVEVAWHQNVASFLQVNWQWLLGTILIPILIWYWKQRGAER